MLKLIFFIIFGAVIGYAYYHFYGCTNGCPLSSNWMVTTVYGAVVGLTLGFPSKKNVKTENDTKSDAESDKLTS